MKAEQLADGWVTLDAGRWVAGPGVIAAGGALTVPQSPSTNPDTTLGHYDTAVESVASWDLTDSQIVVELVTPPGQDESASEARLLVHLGNPDGPWLAFEWESSGLHAGYRLASGEAAEWVSAWETWTPRARYWRIAERDGVIEWATSADLFEWDVLGYVPTLGPFIGTLHSVKIRLEAGHWSASPFDPSFYPGRTPAVFGPVNPVAGLLDDPDTLIALGDAPNLAVDVLPDVLPGTFVVGDHEVGGDELLGWGTGAEQWVNVVCDVQRVAVRRGATRLQGMLTRTEAGEGVVEIDDTERRFDPIINGDAVHPGIPVRVRAWGTEVLPAETVERRRNLVPNPRVALASTGWSTSAATGGTATTARVATGWPTDGAAFMRQSYATASTSVGGSVWVDGRLTSPRPIPVTPGEVISCAIEARSSIAQRLVCRLSWYTAAGAAAGTTDGFATVVTAGAVQRLTVEGVVVPATAAGLLIRAAVVAGTGAVVWPAGSTLDASRAQLVPSARVGSYFDGAQPATGALAYSWLGTVHASAAIEVEELLERVRPWSEVLLQGRVGDDLLVQYRRTGAPLVSFTALDVVSPLARYAGTGVDDPGLGHGERLLARVRRLVAETGRDPDEVLDLDVDPPSSYVATHPSTDLARVWDGINDAADAELGRVWVSRYDRLVVRSRGSQLSGPLRGMLSDWHGETVEGVPHCCYTDATVRFGTELLVNRAIAARRVPGVPDGAPQPAPSAVVQLDDTISQARYDVIAAVENRGLELAGDGELAPWARYLVAQGARPEIRVDSVTLAPWSAGAEAWRAVCATDIGDRWAFRLHPEIGPTVKRGLGVLGIAHDITPDGWTTTLTTVDAPEPTEGNPTGWLVVGDSEIGSGDLLFPRGTTTEYVGFGNV